MKTPGLIYLRSIEGAEREVDQGKDYAEKKADNVMSICVSGVHV